MANKKIALASVLAFEKKLVPSDGFLYGTSWQKRQTEEEPIALIEKSRWILHTLIGNIANANKFVSAEAKRTMQLLSKNRISYTPVPCIYLPHTLCDAQTKILTVGINAGVQLETAITYLMTRIYEGKLTLKVSDETEETEVEERGDVQRSRAPARRAPAGNSKRQKSR